jgi:lipopolysaccharide/colanic/teichoic acid biosynthesis glycosyltransferase
MKMSTRFANRAGLADAEPRATAPTIVAAATWQRSVKRVIDIFGAAAGLIFLSPLLLVIVALVKLHDGGPVLYRRRVVGTRGAFDAFKFRSMRVDADAVLEQSADLWRNFERSYKLKEDPRVTPLGRWMRRFSLDELPQLFNVFVGQMSLVGPRMITAPELEKYGEYQDLLLTVKPGLTGYWQVHGRQEVSYEERVRMDVEYISSWKLAKDLHILWLTPLRVLHGRGAY